MFANGQIFTRVRAPLAADPYSDGATRRDWANSVKTPIPGFGFDPGGSVVTDTVNRSQIITSPTLIWWGPDIPDVTVDDRMQGPDGRVWRVTGHADAPVHPMTGWAPGATWPLELSEG